MRDAVADPAAWLRLDLSRSSGVARADHPDVLRGAAARARGGLQALVIGHPALCGAPLLAVAAANSGSLREVRVPHASEEQAEALLRAAPALQLLEAAQLSCEFGLARAVLRNEPPCAAARVHAVSAAPPQ